MYEEIRNKLDNLDNLIAKENPVITNVVEGLSMVGIRVDSEKLTDDGKQLIFSTSLLF